METQKFSENTMQAQFDKTFGMFANQDNVATSGMQGNSSQTNQSFIQSLSETRNIMSQFAIPQANANTVNVGEFNNLINNPNMKAPGLMPAPIPLNVNYGANMLYNNPHQAPPQPLPNKPLINGDSQDPKAVLNPNFHHQAMQSVNMGDGPIKQEPINVSSQTQKSDGVGPLTDTTGNINTDTSIMCDICGKICKDAGKLKIHKYTHSKDKPFKCEVCFKSFSTSFKLKAHINIHGNEKPHHCPVCNKAFHSKTYLDRHMVVHSTDKPHKCGSCDKAFGRKEHLKRHLLTHSGEKPHQCTFCEKSFRCKSNLITHVLKHNNTEYANTNDNNSVASNNAPAKPRRQRQQHHCTICDAVFTTKSSFNAHVLEHTGRKPYQCDKCDKCFNDKSSLCRHNMVHTGEKPFQCPHCDKCFARRDHLQRHTLTHTGQKPHQCKICPKWFKLKRELNAHVETHKENRPESESAPENQGPKSETPNSQVSVEHSTTVPASQTNNPGQIPNGVPVQSSAQMQGQATASAQPPATQPPLATLAPQLQVPIPPLPIGAIPAHILPTLPQPPPGHVIMNTHPISQLLNQLNMQQQLQNGQVAANPLPTNQLAFRPVLGNGLGISQPQSVTLPANPIPASQALLNNFFTGQSTNAMSHFTLPAISSVMAPQNATQDQPFPPPIKSEGVSNGAYQHPVKSENGDLFGASKLENNALNSQSYLPNITSNNNVINLGMSLPVTSAQNVYTSQSFAAPSQKATTDGDIYGQVENINQVHSGYGAQIKDENTATGGAYAQDEGMANVDHSSLITNAMNSLNTMANCQLSA